MAEIGDQKRKHHERGAHQPLDLEEACCADHEHGSIDIVLWAGFVDGCQQVADS